jgi:hypothetical protein
VLQTIYAALHLPLLVAAGLALLAVWRFPSHLAAYAASADDLARQFLEQRERFEQSGRFRPLPPVQVLEELHAAFKSLLWPDSAASYHWAVSEAMRHDIEALATFGQPRLYQTLRAEADRYWGFRPRPSLRDRRPRELKTRAE